MSTQTEPVHHSVFMFAHQDDEFGVFHAIQSDLAKGRRVWCLYLTDGGTQGVRRNKESIRVLSSLGVDSANILFMGHALQVADGKLLDSLPVVSKWLASFLRTLAPKAGIYIPAWEGGHPDHDGLHLAAVHVLSTVGDLDKARQFSLYHSRDCIHPFFRVMTPIPENGKTQIQYIPAGKRIEYVLHCLRYTSQLKAWIGLLPFVAWSYLATGRQQLQHVNVSRMFERPHPGRLYYESRGYANWAQMERAIAELMPAPNSQ